ncbi:MAG: hypothetical protein O3C21_06215 [Verrucomicrobia bacterium]|nr:hypothetical protein [Verrucomicrobiota bacterium]
MVGALIFAAHPFCTEAVNYAACATIQMVTLFSMLASYHVLRFLESPSRRSMVAGILLIMLAAFAKDPGIFHVGINVGLLCLVLADRSWVGRAKTWLKEKSLSAGIALGILTSGTLYFIVSKWVGVVSSVVSTYGMEYVGHFLTQGRMLWGYLGRMILPIHLHSDHHIAVSRSAGDDPMAVTALAAVVILCALVAIGLFRKKTRAACLLASLVLGHLVLRFAYPIYEHSVEYRAYPSLPWVGLIGGLGFGMLYAIKQKPAILTALGVVVIGCAASATRSALWSNSQMLANDSSLAYELNNRPRCNLQTIAYQSGNYEEVLTIADAIHDAYGKLIAFNQNNPQKREYDPNRALDDLLMCEQMKTYAIAELEGSKAGIEFANERINHFRKNLTPGRRLSTDQEEEVEKALESLLAARKVLTEVGDEYDRRKQEQKRLTAQSEAPVADEK